MKNRLIYRIRYWVNINEEYGEWHTTGLMTQKSAKAIKDDLLKSHDLVEIYKDEHETN